MPREEDGRIICVDLGTSAIQEISSLENGTAQFAQGFHERGRGTTADGGG
jgi:hypothetical protein